MVFFNLLGVLIPIDVRHNGDGEKDGDANQVERDVSAVTEG